MTPCPDTNRLGAFVERRLDPAAQKEIERHLADCFECAMVVGRTARFLHSESRNWWPAAAAAAAAVIIIGVLSLLSRDPMRRVQRFAAAAPVRTYEGRITGFAHRRFSAPRSGTAVPSAPIISIRGDSVRARHARGVALLISGNASGAVRELRSAAFASHDATLWSDLAAAEIASSDFTRALQTADRAIALDPSLAAAHFNRAVAAEHLGRTSNTIRSYEHALALDPSSPWSGEMRERLERLK